MKVSKVFSVKERKTIKDCMRDYISSHMKSVYDSEEEAFYLGSPRVIRYNLVAVTFKYRSFVTYGGKTTEKEASYAFAPDIIFDIPLPESMEKKANEESKSNVADLFDPQWQLKKGIDAVIFDNKEDNDVDNEILLEAANREIEKDIKSKGYAKEKFEWRAELIEDSLCYYIFPYIMIFDSSDDEIKARSVSIPWCYNLAAEPNEYIPPKCNILSEDEPVHKIEKKFNKYKLYAIIAGILAFGFFAGMMENWIFIPLLIAALAGGGYFLYKALPYKPNGELIAEEKKKAEGRKAEIIKRVIDREVEKVMKKENLFIK